MYPAENANTKVLGAIEVSLGALICQHVEEPEQQLPESPTVQVQDLLGVRVREIHADHLVAFAICQLRDELDQVEGQLVRGAGGRAFVASAEDAEFLGGSFERQVQRYSPLTVASTINSSSDGLHIDSK